MEKTLGKEIASKAQRETYLKDNCDAVEIKGYMKPFTGEQMQEHKEKLADLSIKIEEITAEKKAAMRGYKQSLDALGSERGEVISSIRQKAEFVRETCYRITDHETRQTGFYNLDGDLIEQRPATADEMQLTIPFEPRKQA